MRTLIAIILLSTLSLSASAQKSYEKGYIIKSISRDTVWGQIDDKNWNSNPTSISFKQEGGQKQKLGIYDIDEFALKSERTTEVYRKKILDIDRGVFKLADLKNYPQPDISRDTVFATLYESGRINLYYMRDETSRIHYLIEKNDTGIQELRIERYLSGETQSMKSNDIYKNQLSRLMSDCGEVIIKISDVTYEEKELRKLVVYYNNCIDGDRKGPKYSQAKEKVDFYIAPVVGIGFRTEKITSNYFGNSLWGPGINLDASIALGFVVPRSNKHLEMAFEIGWSYFRENKAAAVNNYYTDLSGSLAANLFKGNLLFKYVLPVKKIKFVFDAGVSFSSIVQSYETPSSQGLPSLFLVSVLPKGNFQIASIIGAGIRIRNVNMELRYSLYSSSSGAYYVKTLPNSLNFTFSYNFWINKGHKNTSK